MFFKCAICQRWIHKVKGLSKKITTQDEVNRYAAYHRQAISLNDILCQQCRLTPEQASLAQEPEPTAGCSTSSAPIDSSSDEFADDLTEIGIPRTPSTHRCCLICKSTADLRVVSFSDRSRIFNRFNIYVPEGCRTCHLHSMQAIDHESRLPIVSHCSRIDVDELRQLYRTGSNLSLFEKVKNLELSEGQSEHLTGFSREQFSEIAQSLPTLRCSSARSAHQALFVFLLKLRTGNSQNVLASLLEIPKAQSISSYFTSVMQAFEHVVMEDFGPQALTREVLLMNTTPAARRLLGLREDQVALVLDGTYIRHQKSSNNAFQRRSYSGQKKVPLCKPFTICTTNGFIVDFAGPFPGTANDATIVREVLKDPKLLALLLPGDALVVDRGFRDAVDFMKSMSFQVFMPAMKGKRKQIPCDEANTSRLVTKVRWIVETVHGRVAQRYKLLHNAVDNKMLPKVRSLCRIIGYLENRFCNRSWGDDAMTTEILDYMESRLHVRNTLGELVERERWLRRSTLLQTVSATDLIDFPILTEQQLLVFASGTYQIKLAISYLAEAMDDDDNISMSFVKETPTIVRLDIRSRHINRKTYRVFIEYEPSRNGIEGIRGYWCECPNGNRTVGSCSHVAAAVSYLSHARYQPSIRRPAAELTDLFLPSENEDDADEPGADDASTT